ncbi:uncharacterized protein LOC129748605 [Uranotaenia lowii]|uniref:uncharacterized protein LOC129748605 n=1 Tax=Uranotaenia lowii TaxID=190385 RepID=UPI002479720A|nr:uncharacterized protein LOC129748605 [Uranotaenia lowii]XP_055599251.1 uncharacterized protein LOC129748605 [Uranotaenia lowii]
MPSGANNRKSPGGSGEPMGSKTGNSNSRHHDPTGRKGAKNHGSSNGQQQQKEQQEKLQSLDEGFNSGFGQYIRSEQAVEMMKLFVIANTLVVFFTMGWPQMKQSFEIIRSWIYGGDEQEDEF